MIFLALNAAFKYAIDKIHTIIFIKDRYTTYYKDQQNKGTASWGEEHLFLLPNPRSLPISATPRAPRWSGGGDRAIPFSAGKKRCPWSRGSSPHNRSPGRAENPAAAQPCNKAKEGAIIPGHLSARHNTAACHCPCSMAPLSPPQRVVAQGEASAPRRDPKRLRPTTGEEQRFCFGAQFCLGSSTGSRFLQEREEMGFGVK